MKQLHQCMLMSLEEHPDLMYTIEDVTEEIVGDIEDEHDNDDIIDEKILKRNINDSSDAVELPEK